MSTNSTLKVGPGSYFMPSGEEVEYRNRYIRFATRKAYQSAPNQSAEIRLPEMMQISAPIAEWLPVVERRIQNSILPDEYGPPQSSEWLSESVGQAALNFFRNVSDLLPSEPYIYSSLRGDLVAEFAASRGTMTAVVSSGVISIFANIDGEVSEKLYNRGSNCMRYELDSLKKAISTK